MRDLQRNIDEVRRIRGDLSSWLVHLTRDNFFIGKTGNKVFYPARDCLENILQKDTIYATSPVGQFNYVKWYQKVSKDDLKAVCFTEAPVEEIFLFPHIQHKPLNFSSYGLVFDKDQLAQAPYFAAPVLYFSQPNGNTHYITVFNQLEQKYYQDFKEVLFLFDKFGKTLSGKEYDFRWEREWRHKGNLSAIKSIVKFGLCPESDIKNFESKFPSICFVDPFFSPRQIEHKLRIKGII